MNETAGRPTLTEVDGVSEEIADTLLNVFGSTGVTLDAVQDLPTWVSEHFDCIDDQLLTNLREYASEHNHHDLSGVRYTTSLRGKELEHDGRTYHAVGQRDDNLCLFHTGQSPGYGRFEAKASPFRAGMKPT